MIYIVINTEGGENGDIDILVCAFTSQVYADTYVLNKPHLIVTSLTIVK